jgi:hypothetical protein
LTVFVTRGTASGVRFFARLPGAGDYHFSATASATTKATLAIISPNVMAYGPVDTDVELPITATDVTESTDVTFSVSGAGCGEYTFSLVIDSGEGGYTPPNQNTAAPLKLVAENQSSPRDIGFDAFGIWWTVAEVRGEAIMRRCDACVGNTLQLVAGTSGPGAIRLVNVNQVGQPFLKHQHGVLQFSTIALASVEDDMDSPLTVFESRLYWVNNSNTDGGNNASVVGINALNGGQPQTPVVYASGLHAVTALVADKNFVYWASEIDGIGRSSLATGEKTVFSTSAPMTAPRRIVLNGNSLYWLANGVLRSTPLTGGADTAVALNCDVWCGDQTEIADFFISGNQLIVARESGFIGVHSWPDRLMQKFYWGPPHPTRLESNFAVTNSTFGVVLASP